MNKKWSSKKVRAVQDWLQQRWPELFASGPDRKPLALDIHKEILKFRAEFPGLSRRTLDEALKRHITSHGYLYGMVKHRYRVDLSGNRVERVEEQHRSWASQLLRKKQKDAQRTRKGRKKPMVHGNKGKPAFLDKRAPGRDRPPVSAAASAAPVIRYKQRRRRTVATEQDIELVG